jgi:hypothetical protein
MSDVRVGPVKVRMSGNTCPHCGRTAEGGTAFDIGEDPAKCPKPGDFAVCLYCGKLNTYDDRLRLRAITQQERELIQRDPRLREVLRIAGLAGKKLRRDWQ